MADSACPGTAVSYFCEERSRQYQICQVNGSELFFYSECKQSNLETACTLPFALISFQKLECISLEDIWNMREDSTSLVTTRARNLSIDIGGSRLTNLKLLRWTIGVIGHMLHYAPKEWTLSACPSEKRHK